MANQDIRHLQRRWTSLARPILAYGLACVAAAATMMIVGAIESPPPFDITQLFDVLGMLLFIAMLIAVIALLPALMAAGLLFQTPIPRGIGEVCVGAVLGPALSFLVIYSSVSRPGSLLPQLALFALMGAIAGLVYWLAVGRPKNRRRAAR